MEDKKIIEPMCKDCSELVGAGRHTKPHSNLSLTGSRDVRSIMGAADEEYYACRICGHKWIHETGSCGMGWVK